MKKITQSKVSKIIILGVCLTFNICTSCRQELQSSVPPLFEENPATITWDSSNGEGIDTYSATVSVYSDNNRRTGGAKLQSQYKMSIKTVNDKQYVRLDFPATEKISAKSVLTDGVDTLLVDTASNTIEQKFVALDMELKLINEIGYITSQNTLSKINLSRIKTEASKLSFDMTEKESENVLTVELPSKYFTNDAETRISTKISYDTQHELMETIETVTKMEDGSIVTVTTCPVYEQIENGEIVKIGQYSIIDKKSEVRFEGLEDIEYFESLDNIPEITTSEYEELVASGNAVTIEELPLGDPSDPSYVETVIELYNNIQINTVDDSVFKLIMEL